MTREKVKWLCYFICHPLICCDFQFYLVFYYHAGPVEVEEVPGKVDEDQQKSCENSNTSGSAVKRPSDGSLEGMSGSNIIC